jgi:small subunit ribosomal protein S6
MSVNHYEAVFIMTPVLSDQQMEDTVAKFKSVITDNGGEIYHAENWGLRKLAYTINKKNTGYYQLFEFKAAPTLIATLETEYRRDERIIRFLTVSLDKYGVEYNAKRRNKKFETKTEEVAS